MSPKIKSASYVLPQNQWRILESLSLLVWLVLVGFVSAHHEAWADEAQAWLMARDLPWKELVAHGVRYEGSPALWHTILWILIRMHLPFFYVRWFGELFAAGAVVLLLWFSPFPRVLRLLLPFTFFLAYQDAVVSRSYVLFALLAFGAVVLLTRKQAHPVAAAVVLGLLANTSVHGFVLAVALLCVAAAIWRRSALPARRFVPALGIAALMFALAILTALPPSDVNFPAGLNIVRSLQKLGQQAGAQPAPAAVRDEESMELTAPAPRGAASRDAKTSASHKLLRILSLITFPLSTVRVLGLALFAALILAGFQSRLGWVGLVPYLAILAVFQSLYLAPRHAGIVFVAFLVSSWLCWPRAIGERRHASSGHSFDPVMTGFSCLLFLLCCEQIGWSGHAMKQDVEGMYAPGPETARFLQAKLHGKQAAAFYYHSVAILPYFPANIFENQRQHAYWTWSTKSRISAMAPDELRRLPDYVVVSGWDWGADGFISADWDASVRSERPGDALADTYRIVPFYEAHGYHETHRFCGQTWMRFTYAERICDVVLEPVPPAKARS